MALAALKIREVRPPLVWRRKAACPPSGLARPANDNGPFVYDGLGRVTTGPDGTVYSYDNFGQALTTARDGRTITDSYDALGRLTASAQPSGTVSYQYDAAGRRTRMDYPGGFFVTYDWNDAGQLTAIKENGSATIASFTYDQQGRRVSRGLADGSATTYGYDAASRLTDLDLDLPGSSYDQAADFAYNPAGQIRRRATSNSSYDPVVAASSTTTPSYNGLNQVSSSGFTHNAGGAMTAGGGASFGYDGFNRLTSAGGASLAYDPAGRLWQTAGSATTRFLYDGADLIAEYDGSGNLLRRYVHGPGADEPLAWYEGSGTSSRLNLTSDERGSIVAVNSGAGVTVNTYDDYGTPGAGNSGRFQYTGQTYIPEVGLYNYKARFYSPTLGRFLQPDPTGYADGMNMYAYVGDDPINGTDPTGMACIQRYERTINGRGTGRYFSREVPDNRCSSTPIVLQQPDSTNRGGGGSGGSGGGSGAGGGGVGPRPPAPPPPPIPLPPKPDTECPLVAFTMPVMWLPTADLRFSPQFSSVMRNAVSNLSALGIPVQINSGYRTAADQARMRAGASGSNPAAPFSDHELGNAVDINGTASSNFPSVISAFKDAGAKWGGDYFGSKDPPHFYIRPVQANAQNTAQCHQEND